jgi:hypothetical protein
MQLAGEEILQILSSLELVKEAKWDYKFTDIGSDKQKLVYVNCYSIHHYNLLLKWVATRNITKSGYDGCSILGFHTSNATYLAN